MEVIRDKFTADSCRDHSQCDKSQQVGKTVVADVCAYGMVCYYCFAVFVENVTCRWSNVVSKWWISLYNRNFFSMLIKNINLCIQYGIYL